MRRLSEIGKNKYHLKEILSLAIGIHPVAIEIVYCFESDGSLDVSFIVNEQFGHLLNYSMDIWDDGELFLYTNTGCTKEILNIFQVVDKFRELGYDIKK